MSLAIFLIILVVLIWVHELGHFSVAKLFKVRVEEFSIGFPPRIFRVRRGGTQYSLGLLLVGGYVKIFGEDPGEGRGDSRSLNSRSRWVQAAVLAAGVAFNLVFAWLLLSAGYMTGLPTPKEHAGFGEVSDVRTTVAGVLPYSPAERAGLLPGDVVSAIKTGSTEFSKGNAESARAFIAAHADESMIVAVLRPSATEGGFEQKTFLAKPEEGMIEGRKALGVELGDYGILRLPPHLAFAQGAILAERITVESARGLGRFLGELLRGTADFSAVAGPVGIAGAGAQAVQSGFGTAIIITALISINLAIINVLPIPGLDGGRLLILAIEGAVRRSIPERLVTALTLFGFVLLIALMVAVTASDIARLIG